MSDDTTTPASETSVGAGTALVEPVGDGPMAATAVGLTKIYGSGATRVVALDHVEVVTFPGADHGFSWPGYPNYHEEAAETSWAKTLEMFAVAFA